jgi:parallel beta-helix repeat protein
LLEEALEAVADGGTIRLMPGEHRLARPLVIEKSARLVGDGREITTVAGDGEGCVLAFRGPGWLVAEGITFKHQGEASSSAVLATGGRLEMAQCTFTGGVRPEEDNDKTHGHGLYLAGTVQARLEKNIFRQNKKCGLVYLGSAAGVARENECTENEAGIAVGEQAQPTLQGNTCRKNRGCGILVVSPAKPHLWSNSCAQNGEQDVDDWRWKPTRVERPTQEEEYFDEDEALDELDDIDIDEWVGKKLYVGNLTYSVTSSDLEGWFAQFGTVQSAQVIQDRDTGRSKGFGFVEMDTEAEAQAAIQGLHDQEYDGRRLTVNVVKPTRVERPTQEEEYFDEDEALDELDDIDIDEWVGKKLYVGNLTYKVSSEDFVDLFSQFGTVQSAQVITDRETGRSKGFGFVEMDTEDEAHEAILGLHDQRYKGRRLTVNVVSP